MKKKGYSQAGDGEPFLVNLTKYKLESGLTGGFWQQCCDCGLKHLFTLEVVKGKVKVRAYRAP